MWHYGFLFAPALTIGGGTGEVQRNIVAERVLGLPTTSTSSGQTWSGVAADLGELPDRGPRRHPPTRPGQTVAHATVLRPIDLDRHEKVRARIDLPGVPAGTQGKVLQVDRRHLDPLPGAVRERRRARACSTAATSCARKDFVPVDERVEVEEVDRRRGRRRRRRRRPATAAGDDNEFGVPGPPARARRRPREPAAAAL